MDKESLKFLRALLCSSSPSGYEECIQSKWLERTSEFCDKSYKDVHGNAIAVINPESTYKIMLAGHCDEIGFIVTYITEDGFLNIASIGGVDALIMPGTRVKVLTENGEIDGVIGKKAIHLMDEEERKKGYKVSDLWVDIGAKDKKEAEKYVKIGDAISIAANYTEIMNNLIISKGIDDRIGAFVVSEVLKRISRHKKKLKIGIWGVSTVQEEVGLRGARTSCYGIDPKVGIAIDVGFASDYPTIEKKIVGEVKLGKGPILHRGPNLNPVLTRKLEKIANRKKIPYQMTAEPRGTGTDANVIQLTRKGVATSLVSIPTRYIHTPTEICSLDDVENAVKLITELLLNIKETEEFIP